MLATEAAPTRQRTTMLMLCPIEWDEACVFIDGHHSHHKAPQGWKFGIGVAEGDRICGVATVGRPVAKALDDGLTLEVTRCCTDGTRHAASMLYGATVRASLALGYKRVLTYTLESEKGTSLIAAGWRITVLHCGGGSWSRTGRPRVDTHPTEQKTLWEPIALVGARDARD